MSSLPKAPEAPTIKVLFFKIAYSSIAPLK